MIIFCEECGKKYKIDESKISGAKGHCKCQACGHIMEVVKSAPVPETNGNFPVTENKSVESDKTSGAGTVDINSGMAGPESSDKTPALQGISLNIKFLINALGFMALLGGVLGYIYISFVPALLAEQLKARADSLARACAVSLADPLSRSDDFLLKKIIEDMAVLPGVAYVAVFGAGTDLAAGELGNEVSKKALTGAGELFISGRRIHDATVKIPSSGREVHVGLNPQEDTINIAPLFITLAIFLIMSALSYVYLVNSISKPIRELAGAAQRISLGELDLPIRIKGGGEIQELASSLDRMRCSIKSAIERLRRR